GGFVVLFPFRCFRFGRERISVDPGTGTSSRTGLEPGRLARVDHEPFGQGHGRVLEVGARETFGFLETAERRYHFRCQTTGAVGPGRVRHRAERRFETERSAAREAHGVAV